MKPWLILWHDKVDQHNLLVIEAKTKESAIKKALKQIVKDESEFDEEDEWLEVLDTPDGWELVKKEKKQ